MNKRSIKAHLRKYSIFQKRATTINHAFASAMAPVDEYYEEKIDTVLSELECLKDGQIYCVYCGLVEAQTWDHVFALVKNNEPSGYGHTYGNLVPCCKDCNSKKGNKGWAIANESINANNPEQKSKVNRVISRHINKYRSNERLVSNDQKKNVSEIKEKILSLMKDADNVLGRKQ